MALVAAMLFPLLTLGGGAEGQEEPAVTRCASHASVVADFDGNGTPDLAVGAPGDDLGQSEIDEEPVDEEAVVQADNAGSVNIIYSRPRGTDEAFGLQPEHGPAGGPGPAFLHEDLPGVVGDAGGNDGFGSTLASGDFNGDNIPDLAVGTPGKGNGAGSVHIFYGHPSNTGLQVGDPTKATYNQIFHQNTRFMNDDAKAGDRFGQALAAADFNADGIDDLAVGIPGEDLLGFTNAGAVQVIYGAGGIGLTPEGAPRGTLPDKLFGQHSSSVRPDGFEAGDQFGKALAAGDFDGDGNIDLAVGSPAEDVGSVPDAGAVHILFSDDVDGLKGNTGPSVTTPEGNADQFRFFHQNTGEIRGGIEPGDLFGCSLAGGDFDGDGDDDLAIGVPGEAIGTVGLAGAAQVIYNGGDRRGITATPPAAHLIECPGSNCWAENQIWTENAGGIPGVAKFGDRFGATLHVTNFDAGPEDLVIGAPDEQLYGLDHAGSIRLMQGFQNFGITDTVNLTEPVPAFAQRPSNAIFPAELTEFGVVGDLDYTPVGLVVEKEDRFGASLAAGDFDGDGNVDLVVGTPGESVGLVVNYLTEEVVGVPQDVDEFPEESPIDGLHFDDAEDAGVIQILYANASAPSPKHLLVEGPRPDVMYRDPGFPRTQVDPVLDAVGVPQSNGTGVIGGNIDPLQQEIMDMNLLGNPGLPHPGGTAGDRFGTASG